MKHRLILLWILTMGSDGGLMAEETLYPMFFREPVKLFLDKKVSVPVVQKHWPKKVRLNGCLLSGSYQALWLNGRVSFKATPDNKVLVAESGDCFLQRGEQKIQVGERFVLP
ncbi:MAG: hypothetical protein Q9O24_05785 [Gammaproteobacteria bacterium]|nr:hypothetical protein [Gammaproteobacteria bacterium]